MLEEVIELKVEEGYRLWVKFSDGVNGVVDMSKDAFAGVFAPLKDPQFFKWGIQLSAVMLKLCN